MSPILTGRYTALRPPADDAWRRLVAGLLRGASAMLARGARHVARPLDARQRRNQGDMSIEFHAEAGAPEGALYVEGRFIGYIDVNRL